MNKTKTNSTHKDWNKSGDDNFGRATGAEGDLEEADTIIREAHKRTSGELNVSKAQSQDSKHSKVYLRFHCLIQNFIYESICQSDSLT